MNIDVDCLTPDQVYFRMTQTLIPRPIAWVLSENSDGSLNLAPFSYFNAVCSDPPLVMISVGKKPDGSPKDTRANIEERGHFVIHIAHRDQVQSLSESSATLAAGESEVTRLGLATTPFDGFDLPRLADCPIAYACERWEIREIGGARQSLILGRVRRVFVDDAVTTVDDRGRLRVDAAKVNPIARLGPDQYLAGGEVLRVPRLA
jgi:flavin reductase (DIM6/NTAB) family NADH-FMN oxidoreductase RutF